ncbi:MAG: MFS transporter [Patescibacteria group bacterium]|mgnify:CR=1 FL=1
MIYKILTHHSHPQGKIFAYLALIFSLGICLVNPVFPGFAKTVLENEESISFLYVGIGIASLFTAILSSYLFRKFHRTTIAKTSLLFLAFISIALIFVTQSHSLLALAILRICFDVIVLITLGVFVRDFAKSKNLGKEEGLYYRYNNTGILIGVLLGGFLASNFGFELVFILSATAFLYAYFYLQNEHILENNPAIINKKTPEKIKILQNIKEFFKNKERAKAYVLTIGQIIWAGFKYLYIPLYVLRSGYVASMAGLILALEMLPMIFLEIKAGEYADKHGIKKLMAYGFLFIAALFIMVFFSPWPLVNFALLSLGGFGIAMIEPLEKSHLFKHLPKENEDSLYSIYMTAHPIGYLLAPLMGAGVLLLLPFNFLFLVFGLIMALMGAFAWLTLRD